MRRSKLLAILLLVTAAAGCAPSSLQQRYEGSAAPLQPTADTPPFMREAHADSFRRNAHLDELPSA